MTAALCFSAILGAWQSLGRGGSLGAEAGAFVALVATGVLLFVLLDSARALLRRGGGTRRHVVVSGVEALILFGFGFVAEPFASVDGPRAPLVAALFAVLVVLHAVAAKRAPRLALAVVLAALVASCVAHRLASPGLYGWFHAASCVVAMMSVARLTSVAGSSRALSFREVVLVIVLAGSAAEFSVGWPVVRARAVWRSATTAAFAKPLVLLSDLDRDGAGSLFGSVDCAPLDPGRGPFVIERRDDGIDQDCDGVDAPAVSRSRTAESAVSTEGRPDVLVISIDAFRADAADRLRQTRAVLGAPFEFTLAVAPSVRTMNSFAAMLRGRTLDELPFARDSLRSTLMPNDLPTIGLALRRLGYRSAFVAGHSYLAPRTGIVRGFEFLRRDRMPYDDPSHRNLDAMLDADVAIDLVLDAARSTGSPLFVWAHLMETHTPYRESVSRVFGTSRADYERALVLQDVRIADAVAQFRAIRGRPVVVILLGDHGESFGEHGLFFHSSSAHAEQARVPLLVDVPGVPGRRIGAPVSTSAISATILELVGGPLEPSFTVPGLGECMAERRGCPRVAVTEVFSLGRPGDSAVRAYTTEDDRWIVDRAHDVAERFDIADDPGELRPRTTGAQGVARMLGRP